MAHPHDYIETSEPIAPECINHRRGRHSRSLLRISLKVAEGRFYPATFVIDTGELLAMSGVFTASVSVQLGSIGG
jgi:hypothetical protein